MTLHAVTSDAGQKAINDFNHDRGFRDALESVSLALRTSGVPLNVIRTSGDDFCDNVMNQLNAHARKNVE